MLPLCLQFTLPGGTHTINIHQYPGVDYARAPGEIQPGPTGQAQQGDFSPDSYGVECEATTWPSISSSSQPLHHSTLATLASGNMSSAGLPLWGSGISSELASPAGQVSAHITSLERPSLMLPFKR